MARDRCDRTLCTSCSGGRGIAERLKRDLNTLPRKLSIDYGLHLFSALFASEITNTTKNGQDIWVSHAASTPFSKHTICTLSLIPPCKTFFVAVISLPVSLTVPLEENFQCKPEYHRPSKSCCANKVFVSKVEKSEVNESDREKRGRESVQT